MYPDQQEDIKELQLYEHGKEGADAVKWTAKVFVNVRVVLTENKTHTVKLSFHADERAVWVAETIAEMFGEHKYSVSFFSDAQKINLNDKMGDLQIGFIDENSLNSNCGTTILCLKGGIDQPKVWHRFTNVDN